MNSSFIDLRFLLRFLSSYSKIAYKFIRAFLLLLLDSLLHHMHLVSMQETSYLDNCRY